MSDELNRDLDAQLALWTNFQFPSSSAIPSSNLEEERIFSPERDTASRSRHKALEDFSSSTFFGSVGASLAGDGPSHAAYERAKLQQLHQHLGSHQHTRPDKAYHHSQASGMNDLFSSFLPYNPDELSMGTLVDPFLTPNEYASPAVNGGGVLPPLTLRHTRDGSGRPHQQGQAHAQMQTVDPSTTTLVNRPIIPLSTKRQKAKASPIVIPVDHEYAHTAPASAMGDEDMELGDEHDESAQGPLIDANGLPISAAEDKRRRNTLASARFRQKKKEREAAMERKARELDDRVANLDRECESLRKENRMLRGLLVDGVPAAAATVVGVESVDPQGEKSAPSTANAGPGASVVLLEELVRLLKANSAALTAPNGQAQLASVAGSSKATTGKRKRAGAN